MKPGPMHLFSRICTYASMNLKAEPGPTTSVYDVNGREVKYCHIAHTKVIGV